MQVYINIAEQRIAVSGNGNMIDLDAAQAAVLAMQMADVPVSWIIWGGDLTHAFSFGVFFEL